MDKRVVVARISHALKLDKISPPIPVDSIAQQVERQTGITKVRVQIPLESTSFGWLQQCQIIMKKVVFMYISEDDSEVGCELVWSFPAQDRNAIDFSFWQGREKRQANPSF